MSQVSDFADDTVDIRSLIHIVERHAIGVWRYRWVALLVAWIVCAALWGFVLMLPDRHVASAQVYVDTDSVLRPLLRGLSVEKDVLSDVALMSRSMLTRPNLERVARETDLDITATTPRDFDDLLASLQRRTSIATSGTNIYTISFEDNERVRAVNVVNKLLDTFVENTLGSGQEDSQQAERALKAELDDYERRLTDAEDRLKEFKRQNVGLMPDERGDYYAQLQLASAEAAEVQQALRIATEKAAELNRQLEGEEPVFGIMAGGGAPSDSQIGMLQQRRAELLTQYTEKHPEIVRIDQMLKDLREKRAAEVAAGLQGTAAVTSPLDLNPVYQSLRIQRSRVEVEIASLRVKLRDKQARVEQLRKSVDVIPQVEAELNRLNRDYDVVKARYAEMLRRWEDLQTGKRVKSGTDEVQFRIINPPFAPIDPAGPPRGLFIFASFIVALGAGLGVAFLLNLLRPVFHRSKDLSDFGLPILGSVGAAESSDLIAKRRNANLALGGAFAVLLVALGLVMAFAGVGSSYLRALV